MARLEISMLLNVSMLRKKFPAVLIVFIVILTFIAGCGATIGPAPVKLSAEVGDRISEMQALHQLALERYFESERARIETFLEEKWIPLFLKNASSMHGLMTDLEAAAFVTEKDKNALEIALKEYLLDDEEVSKVVQEIADAVSGFRKQENKKVDEILHRYVEDDKLNAATLHISSLLQATDPTLLMIEWVIKAQDTINLQRKEMLQPLIKAERIITSELTQAYAEMLKANGVVTARLAAANEVKEIQDSFLQFFGAEQHANLLRKRLVNLSDTISKAIRKADSTLNLPDEGTVLPSEIAIKAKNALIEELQTFTDTK